MVIMTHLLHAFFLWQQKSQTCSLATHLSQTCIIMTHLSQTFYGDTKNPKLVSMWHIYFKWDKYVACLQLWDFWCYKKITLGKCVTLVKVWDFRYHTKKFGVNVSHRYKFGVLVVAQKSLG